MHIKITMSINTTKKETYYNFSKNEKFINEKSQNIGISWTIKYKKKNGKITSFFHSWTKKKEDKSIKNKEQASLFSFFFFFFFD